MAHQFDTSVVVAFQCVYLNIFFFYKSVYNTVSMLMLLLKSIQLKKTGVAKILYFNTLLFLPVTASLNV